MSDNTIREAERRWRETGDPESAAVYLRALERAGLLPDQTQVEIPTTAPPIRVSGIGTNQAEVIIPGIATVLTYYTAPVAAIVDDGPIWSPEAAYSRTSERHVRRWFASSSMDITMAEEVTPDRLVDLLRLVPIAEFWPTCDGCMNRRQEVKRREDGRDLCRACARTPSPSYPAVCVDCGTELSAAPPLNQDGQPSCVSCANAREGYEDGGPGRVRAEATPHRCEGCEMEDAETRHEHDTLSGAWLCQDCRTQRSIG